MPVLYGEGTKAFQRLLQMIMKISDGHTIFCWLDQEIYPCKRQRLAS
jgi:hypothetical protein